MKSETQYPGVRYGDNGKPLNDLERIMHEIMELKQMLEVMVGKRLQ